jgi:hypothetical protein
LKLKDPDDPLIEVVAKKVISLASQGTLDPKEIERLVDSGHQTHLRRSPVLANVRFGPKADMYGAQADVR